MVLVEPGAFKTDIWKRNVRICKGAYSRESPNRARFKRYASTVRNGGAAQGDAIDVAKLIVRIARTRNPRLRYRIGNDANFGHWMRALLPWKMWERMVENSLQIGRAPNGTSRTK
jgi:hypothetical protein